MNRLLAIETSGEACSVALHLDGETLERHEPAPMRHAELLLPAIRSLLEEGGVTLNSLDAIAFGRGPGSFTSLRIGIGVVQGLAWGAAIPVIPLSSLATVAQQAWMGAKDQFNQETEILVAVDARMKEVFYGSFAVTGDGTIVARSEEAVSAPEKVIMTRTESTFGAGNGFARYPSLAEIGQALRATWPDIAPRASALIPLARQWLRANEPLPAEAAQPVYVRDHVADKPA